MSTLIKRDGKWVKTSGGAAMWAGTKAQLDEALANGWLADGTAVMVTNDLTAVPDGGASGEELDGLRAEVEGLRSALGALEAEVGGLREALGAKQDAASLDADVAALVAKEG